MTQLSVNVNKIALLRNSRVGEVPSVVEASRVILDAGAQGLTVHPRPDQRHVRPHDCDDLRRLLEESAYAERGLELNIEGNPLDHSHGDHLMPIIRRVKPDQATLVPDRPDQATSDHGWDVRESFDDLRRLVDELHEIGCRVSLFVDPDLGQIERVPATGADRIELYTEGYARAFARMGDESNRVFNAYRAAALAAHELGLTINAGHDLNLHNLPRFLTIPHIAEVSIGHALIADALHAGLPATVEAYLAACSPTR
ncbi:MAG: pyridoxine 5'-phosphate synthase [Planctomycetes bacterium]|jgi:pyridoxine 5-phosphate synthase|nr:pyridoxine 5'-phosphate synthase [Planctomycetota bacterium]